MDQPAKRVYTFGDFRLDHASSLLIRKGQPVALTPKVFDTLLLLLENSGRVIDKDQFMRRLWPDTFVGDDALAQNIHILRKVLEETANGQEYIATVPKRGYRFVAEVQTIDEEHSRTVNGSEARKRQKYLFLGAFAMLLMTVYAAYRYWRPTKAPNPLAKLSQISHWNKPMNDARLSPDGRLVAFSSPVGRVDQIFVMPISGGEPLQITREEGDKDLDGFSPDGTDLLRERSRPRPRIGRAHPGRDTTPGGFRQLPGALDRWQFILLLEVGQSRGLS